MKPELSITDQISTAQIKLSRHQMTEALQKWIAETSPFDLKKVVYSVSGNNLSDVTIEVEKRNTVNERLAIPRELPKPELKPALKTNGVYKKHEKVNKGLYSRLRDYFESEFKQGVKSLKFDDVYELVNTEYPNLQVDRFVIYLYDWRQFPRADYKKDEGIIKLLTDEEMKQRIRDKKTDKKKRKKTF